MKTKSEELNKIWDELQSIFHDYTRFTSRIERQLRNLNVIVIQGKHIKLIFSSLQNTSVIISKTPSDNYAGNQILRQIRKAFEH